MFKSLLAGFGKTTTPSSNMLFSEILVDPVSVISIFKKAGMLRRVVTKIWNREGAFRVGILFEYSGEKAFKDCQKLLEKHYLGHLKDFNTKVVGSRGIVVHEF